MTINERIKWYRKDLGLSQQYIAKKLHISQGAVSQWEKGITKPPAEHLPILADIFGISVDELLGRDPQPVQKTNVVDKALIEALTALPPSQLQRVKDFVAGMKASSED